ncbi:MAG: PqqD family protein [bacterium]|nr:PqqD family protein [bacterium]
MKIKDGFLLKKIANEYIAVSVGETNKYFNGIVHLNNTGAFIWECLEQQTTPTQIVQKLLEKYDVDEKTAEQSVNNFLNIIKENNFLEM